MGVGAFDAGRVGAVCSRGQGRATWKHRIDASANTSSIVKPWHRALTVVLAAGLALHLGLALRGLPRLAREGFLYDDAFYAFQIARNVARGQGATFDGVTPTNGFQPLYVALLVPVYRVAGDDPAVPVAVALVLLALATTATAALVYRLVRRWAEPPGAVAAAAAWTFSPVVVRETANGLETALAAMMAAATLCVYLEHLRGRDGVRTRTALAFGALSALAVLAREDLALLVLVLAVDHLLVLRRRAAPARALRAPAWAALAALVVYAPWAAWGIRAVGSPFQESGVATRFLSRAYAPLFGLAPRGQAADTGALVWHHVRHAASVLRTAPPLHPVFRVLGRTVGAAPPAAALAATGLVALALSVAALAWWRRTRSRPRRDEMGAPVVFAGLVVLAYATWIFGAFFFTRYFVPVFLVVTVVAGVAADDARRALRAGPRAWRTAARVAALGWAVALAVMAFNAAVRPGRGYPFYDIACWVREHTAPGETIGVFQSGAVGYLSGRRVVNLDGKVDRLAREALRSGRIARFVREQGVDAVVDDAGVLDLFFGPFSRSTWQRLSRVAWLRGREVGAPTWLGLRIEDALEAARASRVVQASAAAPPGVAPAPGPSTRATPSP